MVLKTGSDQLDQRTNQILSKNRNKLKNREKLRTGGSTNKNRN